MPGSPTAQIDLSRCQCGDPALLQALATPAMYRGAPRVVVHETHASWVFVAGERAYKVKKPVALGFLDYSTLELRHGACREEVRVNQDLAPGVYLGVRAIVPDRDGFRIVADGTSGAVEYVVEMRAFCERDTLAGLIEAGALTRGHVVAVARLLARFHRSAAVVDDWDAQRVLGMWRRNLQELERAGRSAGWCLEAAERFGETFIAEHAADIDRRGRLGFARDGHGDLRCEHVLVAPTVRVVDRIEFDVGLRSGDVGWDLAFLAMDLEASGHRWAARELSGAYRAAGMDPGSESLRSFYGAYWALVRAKVALIAAEEHQGLARSEQLRSAQQLWSLGERLCWRARSPLAIVICGPAASGKSVLAGELARRSGMPVVCSDAVRKRLAHLQPSQRAGEEIYTASFNRATYTQLSADAVRELERDEGVIVDATCRLRADRAVLLDGLAATGARVLIVRCDAPLELLRQRAARRLGDPRRVSDATPQVAEEHFRDFEDFEVHSEGAVLRLDTAQALDTQLAELTRTLDGAPARL